MSRRQTTIQIGLFLFSCSLYSNTLLAGFTFDDNFAVINNQDVTNRPLFNWQFLKNDFWGQPLDSKQSHKSYRPITIIMFRMQHLLGQKYPKGEWGVRAGGSGHNNAPNIVSLPFHAANILLHAVVSVLVFRLASSLIRRRELAHAAQQSDALSTSNLWWEALLAAGFFSVHPVHTEAVAGVVGQAELLCAALAISSLLAYMHAAIARKRGAMWLTISVLLIGLSTLAKEIGITTTAAAVALDIWLPIPPQKQLAVKTAGTAHMAVQAESDHTPQTPTHKQEKPSPPQWPINRWLILGVTAYGYICFRSWLAVDQLVSIYRKVENPIPFAESATTRALSIAYLHARYFGLLIAPAQLSADWSFSCIPLVETFGDPRSIASATLYAALAALALKGLPWASAKREYAVEEQQLKDMAKYRAYVMLGLMIGPFIPSSNLFFYVGTFIGERLLYMPSIGFCLLAASFIADGNYKAWRLDYIVKAALVTALLAISAQTWMRNRDWSDEETLFIAAHKICPTSAKVQQNMGIIERRYRHWDQALEHFQRAREIEPGYCEPGYWIGVTLVAMSNRLGDAIEELEAALDCKYVAFEASKALAQIFHELMEQHPGELWAPVRWAKILQKPPLRRVGEACDVLERTTLASQQPDVLEICFQGLQEQQHETQYEQLEACIRARMNARAVLGSDSPRSSKGRKAMYSYLRLHAPACRQHPGALAVSSGHTAFINSVQKEEPENPWLHSEWAEVLTVLGRTAEAGRHFQVAGLLLRQWLGTAARGHTLLGIHPVSRRVAEIGHPAVAAASLKAMQAFRQSQEGEDCMALKAVCDGFFILLHVLETTAHDMYVEKEFSTASVSARAQACTQELMSIPRCS